MIRAETVLEKFHQKPSQAVFSTVFIRDNSPPEVDSDAISGVAVDNGGMNVQVKFCDLGQTVLEIFDGLISLNERVCRSLSHKAETPFKRFA